MIKGVGGVFSNIEVGVQGDNAQNPSPRNSVEEEVNQLAVGDKVKRIGKTDVGEGVEAFGMTGTIRNIEPRREWPPQSGRIVPKMYFIHFPELYKGTKYDGVQLGVVREDLERVVEAKEEITFNEGPAAAHVYLTEGEKRSTFTFDWSYDSVYFQLHGEKYITIKIKESLDTSLLDTPEKLLVFKNLLYRMIEHTKGYPYTQVKENIPQLEALAGLLS